MKAKAICDGRGNAGTGACAVVLELEDGQIFRKARQIMPTTNIVAEHMAIQLAMELALEHGVTELLVWNDSQTPVNHVLGIYKVKQDHLKPIVEKTWEMGGHFEKISIEWVPRELTKEPDLLCREIDRPQRPSSRRDRPGGPLVKPERKNPFAA